MKFFIALQPVGPPAATKSPPEGKSLSRRQLFAAQALLALTVAMAVAKFCFSPESGGNDKIAWGHPGSVYELFAGCIPAIVVLVTIGSMLLFVRNKQMFGKAQSAEPTV